MPSPSGPAATKQRLVPRLRLRPDQDGSDLVILDASDFVGDPVAGSGYHGRLPVRIHGNWIGLGDSGGEPAARLVDHAIPAGGELLHRRRRSARPWDLVQKRPTADAVDHHTGFDGGVDDFDAVAGQNLRHLTRPRCTMMGNHHGTEFVGADRAISKETCCGAVTGASTEPPNFYPPAPVASTWMERREEPKWAIAERCGGSREWTRRDVSRRTRGSGPPRPP